MARKKFYRINQFIRSPQLRVIGEDGKQIGIFSLAEAQRKAREAGLDLVEVAPTVNPPVAKIIGFKKFLYLEEKREKETKKKISRGELKGIRLSPFMAKGDFDFRVKRAEEFLKEGNKVRVEVRFSGRELRKREFGYQILEKFVEALVLSAKRDQEPKWYGRSLVTTLSPVKKGKDEQETKNENQKVGEIKV